MIIRIGICINIHISISTNTSTKRMSDGSSCTDRVFRVNRSSLPAPALRLVFTVLYTLRLDLELFAEVKQSLYRRNQKSYNHPVRVNCECLRSSLVSGLEDGHLRTFWILPQINACKLLLMWTARHKNVAAVFYTCRNAYVCK